MTPVIDTDALARELHGMYGGVSAWSRLSEGTRAEWRKDAAAVVAVIQARSEAEVREGIAQRIEAERGYGKFSEPVMAAFGIAAHIARGDA